jgi:hypothetical protein
MLIMCLILSVLLLAATNLIALLSRRPAPLIAGFCLAYLIGQVFFMSLVLAVAPALQALLLCPAAFMWHRFYRGRAFFLLSCGATLLAYGLSGVLVVMSEREYARLRTLYPFESMEGRLPAARPVPSGARLALETSQRLSGLEETIFGRTFYREHQLRALHEDMVALFINSPGFGVMRMILPNEEGLVVGRRSESSPLQPGARPNSIWSPGEQEPPHLFDEELYGMLDDSILDFVNPWGFGYFKDRRHVAGFETHRFSRVPWTKTHWDVQTLELVSLLLHDEPEVYVSDNLPQMNRLHNVPTRPLDRFESYGLRALRDGEDLFISKREDGARMLGAVRSVKQCNGCHGCERGDLLGAFSYTLRTYEE